MRWLVPGGHCLALVAWPCAFFPACPSLDSMALASFLFFAALPANTTQRPLVLAIPQARGSAKHTHQACRVSGRRQGPLPSLPRRPISATRFAHDALPSTHTPHRHPRRPACQGRSQPLLHVCPHPRQGHARPPACHQTRPHPQTQHSSPSLPFPPPPPASPPSTDTTP